MARITNSWVHGPWKAWSWTGSVVHITARFHALHRCTKKIYEPNVGQKWTITRLPGFQIEWSYQTIKEGIQFVQLCGTMQQLDRKEWCVEKTSDNEIFGDGKKLLKTLCLSFLRPAVRRVKFFLHPSPGTWKAWTFYNHFTAMPASRITLQGVQDLRLTRVEQWIEPSQGCCSDVGA